MTLILCLRADNDNADSSHRHYLSLVRSIGEYPRIVNRNISMRHEILNSATEGIFSISEI